MLLMLSHAVCFSAFLDSLFCKRAYPPQGYARFFVLYTPGMYNEADWKQFYRLDLDGIGGAGGTAQGVDGLGYGYYSRYTLYT